MRSLAPQGLRYSLVGIINTLVGLGTIYAFLFVGLGPRLANLFGFVVGLAVSFSLNARWTFRADKNDTSAIVRYAASAALCYILNLAIVVTVSRRASINIYIAQMLGVFAYTLAMFTACRLYVFRVRAP